MGLPTQETPHEVHSPSIGAGWLGGHVSCWEHSGVCRGLVALTEVAVSAGVSRFPHSFRSVPRSGGSPSTCSCVP